MEGSLGIIIWSSFNLSIITPSIWKVWLGSFNLCAILWSLGPGYNRWPEIIYENYHHCAGITWPMYIYYLIWSFLPYACSYVSLYTIWQYFHPNCVGCKHLKPNCHKMNTILWYHLCSESLRCLTTTVSSKSSTSAGWECVFPGRQWSTGKNDLEDICAFFSQRFPSSVLNNWVQFKRNFWRLVNYGLHIFLVIRLMEQ